MNNEHRLSPQAKRSSQPPSVADALLLEQLIRQKELENATILRSLALGTTPTPTAGVVGEVPPLLLQQTRLPYSLPLLPPRSVAATAQIRQALEQTNSPCLPIADLLRQAQFASSTSNVTGKIGANEEVLRRPPPPQHLQVLSPAAALVTAMQTDRVVPNARKKIVSVPQTEASQCEMGVPPPPMKKRRRDIEKMPLPKRRKREEDTHSPSSSASSMNHSFTFPLPATTAAPKVQQSPKLISFQRTWGKLEKSMMRTELFRRQLEQGSVHLTGVTRSVLQQAKRKAQREKLQQDDGDTGNTVTD